MNRLGQFCDKKSGKYVWFAQPTSVQQQIRILDIFSTFFVTIFLVRYFILGVFSTFFVTKKSQKVHRVLWLDTVYCKIFPLFLSQNCLRRFIQYCGQILHTGSFFHFFVTKMSKVHIALQIDTAYWEFFFHFFCHKKFIEDSQSSVVRYCILGLFSHFFCHKNQRKFIESYGQCVYIF